MEMGFYHIIRYDMNRGIVCHTVMSYSLYCTHQMPLNDFALAIRC